MPLTRLNLSTMTESEDFLSLAIREFRRLKKLSDDAVSQLTSDQFFQSESDGDNSIAIIYKHLAGNMRSRWRDFLTTDGEKPDRDRDAEFVLQSGDTYDSLIERSQEGWNFLFEALSPLETKDLTRPVRIRGEELSVMQATARQMTHYAYHVGQIVYLAKHLAGKDWKSLSIPRGGSVRFNQSPSSYIAR